MSDYNQNRDLVDEESDFRKRTKTSSIPSSILLRHVSKTTIPPNPPHVNLEENDTGKQKRRTKNMNDGRQFECQHCNKTYLSYPALYTHMKTKHINPDEALPMGSGRSRGRPKKVLSPLV